jgi:L-asparaginase
MPEKLDRTYTAEEVRSWASHLTPELAAIAAQALKPASDIQTPTLNRQNSRANVFVLYTGGTIGMVPQNPDNPASPLVPGDKTQIQHYAPGLGEKHRIFWHIEGLPGEEPLDSSDVNSKHWKKMAEVVRDQYEQWDGFVILHGTDTMAYTASALSFMFRYLAKPVVITGSQLPIFDERSDARLNLSNAIQVAGYKATGLPRIPEVVLCFGNSLLRGNRSRKDSTSDLNGFISPNYPPLGTLGEHISINTSLLLPLPESKFSIATNLGPGVMDISLFPGLGSDAIGALLRSPEVKGVVMRTFGAGNAMNDVAIHAELQEAIKLGKPVLNITQCPKGMVEMGLYAASSALLEMGVISGLDMTPEAALTKMQWLLGSDQDDDSSVEEAQLQLQLNQRGEQSESLFDVRFGAKGSKDRAESLYKTSNVPPGQYLKDRLKRAVLRISGLEFSQSELPQDVCVYVSYSDASISSDPDDPRRVARITQDHQSGGTFIAEITSQIEQFTEPGRRISLAIVSTNGRTFWYRGLYLALFASA